MGVIRPPAVAGMFYPASAKELAASVRYYLAEAQSLPATGEEFTAPKALVVPHAGYIYSGLTAAAAYRRIESASQSIKRVILMGPCHRVAVEGIALPDADSFSTPLGNIPIDQAAVEDIINLPQVRIFDETHKEDHALEVHLPFLQELLDDFTIVPMIVGRTTPEQVADVLTTLWGGPETLIVISSDLSHYLPYDQAKTLDSRTSDAIVALDIDGLGDDQACGRHSLKGLLTIARRRHMSVSTIDLRNSGDTAGSKDRVVGYGSWIFCEPFIENEFDEQTRLLLAEHGETLLEIARQSIRTGLELQTAYQPDTGSLHPDIMADVAAFITLEKDGKLRGCIGSLAAHQPLALDVAQNAFKAAFKDPRFQPLTQSEWDSGMMSLTVTVLSPNTALSFADEAGLKLQLRPGIDGVLIQDGNKRGVFLPAVWESLPETEKFFSHLKRKAGLPADYWSDTLRAWRFTTQSVSAPVRK